MNKLKNNCCLYFRNTSFEACYSLKEEDIKIYINNSEKYIHHLNIDHCYWWSKKLVHWVIGKCQHLKSLHVIECQLKPSELCKLISKLKDLNSLSFSVQTVCEVKRDNFTEAAKTLKNLKRLELYFSSSELSLAQYHGELPTILDLCPKLQELHVNAQRIAVPELYRPVVSDPAQHTALRKLKLTSNIHAGAQMYFYGVLSQLPHDGIHLKSLLLPNVNLKEFTKSPDYVKCLEYMEDLEEFDLSETRLTFPMWWINLERATKLRYLNVGGTKITSDYLSIVCESCPWLISVNLHNCQDIFRARNNQVLFFKFQYPKE